MSDAFGLGIQASLAEQTRNSTLANTYAQVYSNVLQHQAAIREAETRAYWSMQETVAKIKAATEQAKLQNETEIKKEQMQQAGLEQRSWIQQMNENYRKEADMRNQLRIEAFKGEVDLQKQHMRDNTDLSVAYVNARSKAHGDILQGRSSVYNNAINAGYDPVTAKTLSDNYDGDLRYSLGISRAPKQQLEEAKFKAQYRPRGFRGDGSFDPGGTEIQKLVIDAEKNRLTELATTTENIKNLSALDAQLTPQLKSVTEQAGGDWPTEAKRLQAMADIHRQFVLSGQTDDPKAQEAYQLEMNNLLLGPEYGPTKIPLHYLYNYFQVKSALNYNLSRGSEAMATSMKLLPTQQMFALHDQMPPDTKDFVQKLVDFVVPGGIQGAFKTATVSENFDVDDTLRSIVSTQLKRQGISPKAYNQQMEVLNQRMATMDDNQKIAMMQMYGGQDPNNKDVIRSIVANRESLGQGIARMTFGDFAGGPLKEGHMGIAGDAALIFFGTKILGAIGKTGIGKWVAERTGLGKFWDGVSARAAQVAGYSGQKIAQEAGLVNYADELARMPGFGKSGNVPLSKLKTYNELLDQTLFSPGKDAEKFIHQFSHKTEGSLNLSQLTRTPYTTGVGITPNMQYSKFSTPTNMFQGQGGLGTTRTLFPQLSPPIQLGPSGIPNAGGYKPGQLPGQLPFRLPELPSTQFRGFDLNLPVPPPGLRIPIRPAEAMPFEGLQSLPMKIPLPPGISPFQP